ncbi:hypothetical protein G7081_01650 [Vagococcus coleopterorum]|uniref:NlpC/P60 domain-containing protein n=1 Tax=Vagococcus coleopterorum TaxID=2714946 RepID=A0A6G8ALL9_9ENTE|nr:C40 family peptidase [Vagococcus coleopterorum]QIL45887.1 hypothetical protein G7081_01650 [Vagococcus coleopterorum]
MKKRILSTVMISSMMFGATVLPVLSSASPATDSDKKISDLSSKEAAANAELTSVRENIANIQAKASALQAEQVSLNKETKKLTKEITSLTERIEKREAAIKDQARSVQTDRKGTTFIDAVLNAESVSEAITRVAAATRLVGAGNDLMVEQQQDKKAVEKKKEATEEKVATIQNNAAKLEAKKGELITQELQKAAVSNGLAAEKATEKSKKDEFLAEAKAAEKALEKQEKAVAKAESSREEVEVSKGETTPQTEAPKEETTPQTEAPKEETTPETEAPVQKPEVPTTPANPNASGSAIVAEAMKHIGKPYVWGAKGPESFDCSGFTAYVYRAVTGKEIGGWTVPQESAGTVIPLSQAQAGDLLFWGPQGGTHHVAISTGGTGYVHAPTEGQTVTTSNFAWYSPDFAVRVN